MTKDNPYLPQAKSQIQHKYPSKALSNSAAPLGPLQPVQSISPEKKHEIFQTMLVNLKSEGLNNCIVEALTDLLKTDHCYVWIRNHTRNTLFAQQIGKSTITTVGVLGKAFNEKNVIYLLRPSQSEFFSSSVDFADYASIYIPLLNEDTDEAIGVAQAVRKGTSNPFSDLEVANAEFFCNKFKLTSHLINPGSIDVLSAATIAPASSKADIALHMEKKIIGMFRCKMVEFWTKNNMSGDISRYSENNDFVDVKKSSIGALNSVFNSKITLITNDITKCVDYDPEVDGKDIQDFIAVPYVFGNNTFVVVLRGKEPKCHFSNVDAMHIESIVPAIARAMLGEVSSPNESDNNSQNSENKGEEFALRLQTLLEVAEILSGVLDIDVLVPTIMERSCTLLNTERCSLFLIDQEKKELVTRFHGGLDKNIRLPISRGIVGHTATTGDIVNITDAYSDPRFDKEVDLETGFKTKSLLTVPIYNNRGEIAGVTEMINRIDGDAFDNDDIKMMMAFNVFCGISLDNAKLYQSSLDLTRQLRGFVEMSSALNTTKTMKDVLREILINAKSVISASRATLFIRDVDNDTLVDYVSVGGSDRNDNTFAKEIAKLMKPKIYNSEEVMAAVQDSNDDPTPTNSRKLSRVSSALSNGEAVRSERSDDFPHFHPICGFPLLTSDSRVLGVMELECNWKILPEDMKLLDCFAVFAAVSLEKAELEQIAKFGQIEINMKKWVAQDEREGFDIPEKLIIPPEKKAGIFTVHFDAPMWDGIGLFKIVWTVMDFYDLFKTFKINNEQFFKFISELSQTYNKVPYHNWRHAVDVTQYVMAFEVPTAKVDTVFTKFELLALTISSICHDANHDGFTNVFNEKAETPLGILFKNQSVMETHHCTVSIGIISKEETNIFHSLSSTDYRAIWTLIIQLILITDMAKHFDFLKRANAELDKGPFDLENPEHRLMMMQSLLKCGDISNVSRPFELADKWCDVLCEEFFRQGDLEMASGMEYTSPLNDREHLDKPKSQIGFYTFVCMPLYQVTARAFPPLQMNVDQIQSNLAVWKAAAAEKEQQAPAGA